jgi:thiol-disulfide isomerase/thioredoxin
MPRRPVAAAAFGLVILFGTAASAQVRDIEGRPFTPFTPADKARVLVFVATDCPVSNSYAPEIQRVCKAYADKGVSCALAYEDVKVDAGAVRAHLDAYGYRGIPAAIDNDRALADRTRASITPEAVVIDGSGRIRYQGRIDNLYTSLGKTRQVVTEHDLTNALDAVLAGRPVARAKTEAIGCFIPRD